MKEKKKDIKYEDARIQRSFNELWKQEFKWLSYEEETGLMKCYACVEKYGNDPDKHKRIFVVGCSNFRKTSVKDHDGSNAHRRAQAEYDTRWSLKEPPLYAAVLNE